ncbi:MAG: DNA replication and repair protein RecF [Candidatus Sericytochromatia bacterium]|nr:MAG: DNA replication and repair protein RecF [Candidatus Sericytochromatia bacterium]
MIIKSLTLTNFRNYDLLDLSNIDKKRILFIGDNAQGKTNILEAIYILSFGNSYRKGKESDLIKFGHNECALFCELDTVLSTKKISLLIRKNSQKSIKIDGNVIKKTSDLVGNLKIVFFNVEDLNLIKGAPSDRRAFIDKVLSQIHEGYYYQLQVYNKLLQQKNITLKSLKDLSNKDHSLLDILDEEIAEISSKIYFNRISFINEILEFINNFHSKISGLDEKVDIKYEFSIPNLDFRNNLKEQILKYIENNRFKEIMRGQSLYGPHRDDITFYINSNDAKIFSSQGQQRTLVLALKLSEIKYINKKTKQLPILLLDDVMAELDNNRQNNLLELIGNDTQTFITTTHLEDFSKDWLNDTLILKVSNGNVCLN